MAWAGLFIGALLGFSLPWVREAARHPPESSHNYPSPRLIECLILAGLLGGGLALLTVAG
jgi:hypothetical protein